jgi:hypothetical protein
MVYLQTTYELCFREAYFEYFESCDFSRENTNIDVSITVLVTVYSLVSVIWTFVL